MLLKMVAQNNILIVCFNWVFRNPKEVHFVVRRLLKSFVMNLSFPSNALSFTLTHTQARPLVCSKCRRQMNYRSFLFRHFSVSFYCEMNKILFTISHFVFALLFSLLCCLLDRMAKFMFRNFSLWNPNDQYELTTTDEENDHFFSVFIC